MINFLIYKTHIKPIKLQKPALKNPAGLGFIKPGFYANPGLLAVWVIAYVSRTFFSWHDPLPLGLGISSLASVVLAGHRENIYVSYPNVYLPPELKISSLASVVLF